jgi:hypothetical protein
VHHLSTYAHFHTIGVEELPPRTELHQDVSSTLSRADRLTSLIVLSDDPDPLEGFGSLPRMYIGGTVYTEQGLRADWPDYADYLIERHGPCLIEQDSLWMAFRSGDVRYPTPRHVRLERGELLLHDADLLRAVCWD